MLEAKNISWIADKKSILNNVSFRVKQGEFLGLIGPNGSGKTSMMSILAGLRQATEGSVLLNGQPLSKMSRNTIARHLAFVEQHADTDDHITAQQTVELGRTPHLSALSPWSQNDTKIVHNALNKVNMHGFEKRLWKTLSGGEKQRLHFARALAQEPAIMLLDEPTNHLDIQHQLSLLQLVRQESITVVSALHDLNHAALFCDRIAVLHEGRLVALGTPHEVLTPTLIFNVFKVQACVENDEDGIIHVRFRCPSRPTMFHQQKEIA